MIAVSYSRMTVFEHCPQRAKFAFIDKIPEPQPDTETAAARGMTIHQLAEDYVSGKLEKLPTELKDFSGSFDELRDAYNENRVVVEDLWCFNEGWQRVENDDWSNIWLRIKADATEHKQNYLRVIDYKTGKKLGNEVKHDDQLGLYVVAAFMMHPSVELIDAELWYLDQGETTARQYTRTEAMRRFERYNKRLLNMSMANDFPAKPSIHNCRFCPYKTGSYGTKKYSLTGTGSCEKNPL